MKEVREGYKMTELGEIPVEWEVKSISEVFDVLGGMSLSRAKTGSGDSYYLHYGDIHKNKKSIFDTSVDFNWLPKINSNEIKIKEDSILKNGDIVFADASEDYADIGKNVVVKVASTDKFIAGLHTIFIREKQSPLDLKYKAYVFKTDEVRKQIKVLATGTTVLGISKPNISKIKFAIPSYKEQQKIGEILSSVDIQIEQTEQLIEKTKELKKGLMQQFLTKGIKHTEFKKTDIGEIPVEWEITEIGEISELITKGTTPTTVGFGFTDEGINYIKSENLDYNGRIKLPLNKISEECHLVLNRSQINSYDILVSIVGARLLDKVALVDDSIVPANTNQNIAIVRLVKEKVVPKYIYYLFKSKYYITYVDAQTTTSAQPSLSLKQVGGFKIPLPCYKEQQIIAQILSIVDKQIETYEQEKLKYALLKKGLMQQLLTGKVRVKVD